MLDEQLEKIKEIVESHEARIRKLEETYTSSPALPKKKISLREFLNSKKPKDDVQRTLLIGYFLENNEGISSFNVKDLEEKFRSAKEKVPKNMNDKLYLCIQRGFMQEAKEKKNNLKACTLTGTGETYVERDFKR